MLVGNTLPVRRYTHLCSHLVVCVSVYVYVCIERCLTFPLCWEQISAVPLPGRASSTVHSSLLLSGEACCASMRLEGVTAPTIQGCRKHKPETGGKRFGTSWSKSYDGTLFVEKVVWPLISNNLNFHFCNCNYISKLWFYLWLILSNISQLPFLFFSLEWKQASIVKPMPRKVEKQ